MAGNAIAKEVVDADFRIHTTLGSGLLDRLPNSLGACVEPAGSPRGEPAIDPVVYDGIRIHTRFRADLVFEEKVIVKSNPWRRSSRFTRGSF